MLKPIFTEKSLQLAKQGKYTFKVGVNMTKKQVAAEIAKLFKVKVTGVNTIKISGENGKNARGKKFSKIAGKKAIIALKDGDKINVFEEGKK